MSSMSSPFITPVERLATFFDPSSPRDAYTDTDIDEIASLLERCGHATSKCPRTYILLRTIGELRLLERLVNEGFTDQWFPVELRGLPSFLDPSTKARMVQAQNIILTKSLDLEHGRHRHFTPGEALPFEILGRLGSGGYSQIDKIVSKVSCRQYALKRMRRRVAFGNNSKEAMERFKSEIRIVKNLEHRHIVQYVGSYTDKSYLGLVMSPVADTDLAAFLEQTSVYVRAALPENAESSMIRLRYQARAMEMCSTLQTYFGCLATALAYLHDRSIRHKDIKPQNILVDKGNVLLTDFGLSRDFRDDVGSTTSGLTPASPRYSPPEVAAFEARNTSADVWSLGCVFFEMVAAMQGYNVSWMKKYFSGTHSMSSHYYANPQASSELIDEWTTAWDAKDGRPLQWIERMVRSDRSSRPMAAEVVEMIVFPDGHDHNSTTFCGICCVPDEETDSNDSLVDEPTIIVPTKRPGIDLVIESKQDSDIAEKHVDPAQESAELVSINLSESSLSQRQSYPQVHSQLRTHEARADSEGTTQDNFSTKIMVDVPNSEHSPSQSKHSQEALIRTTIIECESNVRGSFNGLLGGESSSLDAPLNFASSSKAIHDENSGSQAGTDEELYQSNQTNEAYQALEVGLDQYPVHELHGSSTGSEEILNPSAPGDTPRSRTAHTSWPLPDFVVELTEENISGRLTRSTSACTVQSTILHAVGSEWNTRPASPLPLPNSDSPREEYVGGEEGETTERLSTHSNHGSLEFDSTVLQPLTTQHYFPSLVGPVSSPTIPYHDADQFMGILVTKSVAVDTFDRPPSVQGRELAKTDSLADEPQKVHPLVSEKHEGSKSWFHKWKIFTPTPENKTGTCPLMHRACYSGTIIVRLAHKYRTMVA